MEMSNIKARNSTTSRLGLRTTGRGATLHAALATWRTEIARERCAVRSPLDLCPHDRGVRSTTVTQTCSGNASSCYGRRRCRILAPDDEKLIIGKYRKSRVNDCVAKLPKIGGADLFDIKVKYCRCARL